MESTPRRRTEAEPSPKSPGPDNSHGANACCIVSYDMPEHAATMKLKVLTSVFSENAVRPFGVALTLAKKLY